jgi:hypothetical protein
MNEEMASIRHARRQETEMKAASILTHYMRRAWEAAGLPWTGGNDDEMAEVVSLIAEAASS